METVDSGRAIRTYIYCPLEPHTWEEREYPGERANSTYFCQGDRQCERELAERFKRLGGVM